MMKRFFVFFKFYFEDKYLIRLIILIAVSAALIIATNYYTIKIMSSMRAYIYGESQYSKGEKDAAQNLILFLNTEEEKYFQGFMKNIQIPQGDSIARVKLSDGSPSSEIRSGFLEGMNHADDLDDMIWLFRNFKNTSFMKIPIQNWQQGDSLIYQKFVIGMRVKRMITGNNLNEKSKNDLVLEVIENSYQLTLKERAFSESLGESSRQIGFYLLYFNIFFTLIIFINANIYAAHVFGKLNHRNKELVATNQELDKFVYSASHDLRAPISSLKGLVAISKMEKDPNAIQHYLSLMTKTLDKQDAFIKDIIDFSKNKKLAIAKQTINLDQLIDDSIDEHAYMPGALDIKVEKDYNAHTVQSDAKRLAIIINNLISNAIKYYDPGKLERTLRIKTALVNHFIKIEMEDNGIGIDEKFQPHIFDMFYVASSDPKGSGLGLYIAKETVEKLGGNITMTSQINKGTRFIIQLPNGNKS